MKKICLFVVFVFILNTFAYAYDYIDIKGHWAYDDIISFSQHKIIEGYEGKFKPDDFITRGEAAVIMNRLFNLITKGENYFKDLENTWYTDAVLCLSYANIMQGDGLYVYPENNISKQEALSLIAKALGILNKSDYIYTDAKYSPWATKYVGAIANKYALPNSFYNTDLKDDITRAEFVYILNHLISLDFENNSHYSVDCQKSAVLNKQNISLSNMKINGNLIIGENSAKSDISIKNVDISGDIIIFASKEKCNVKLDFVTFGNIKYVFDEIKYYNRFIDMPISFDDIENLSSTKNSYGQGNNVDENNRPITASNLQEKYKNYDALFIGEKSDKIYLTFDEGYENGYTAKILDVLKQKNCSAVFFVTMDYAKKNSDLIKRMIDEGHVVGNHSVNHYSMPTLSNEKCAEEIISLHKYIRENFGYEMYLFRPPMGEYSEKSLAIAKKLGYKTMLWSFAYRDWLTDDQPDTAYAKHRILKNVHGGGIFLLHAVSKTNTEILGEVIDGFRYYGYNVGAFNINDK